MSSICLARPGPEPGPQGARVLGLILDPIQNQTALQGNVRVPAWGPGPYHFPSGVPSVGVSRLYRLCWPARSGPAVLGIGAKAPIPLGFSGPCDPAKDETLAWARASAGPVRGLSSFAVPRDPLKLAHIVRLRPVPGR